MKLSEYGQGGTVGVFRLLYESSVEVAVVSGDANIAPGGMGGRFGLAVGSARLPPIDAWENSSMRVVGRRFSWGAIGSFGGAQAPKPPKPPGARQRSLVALSNFIQTIRHFHHPARTAAAAIES